MYSISKIHKEIPFPTWRLLGYWFISPWKKSFLGPFRPTASQSKMWSRGRLKWRVSKWKGLPWKNMHFKVYLLQFKKQEVRKRNENLHRSSPEQWFILQKQLELSFQWFLTNCYIHVVLMKYWFLEVSHKIP